jgi:hypothetical protein
MAKTSERLSALKVGRLSDPGLYADGGNLYFRVAPGGARGWIFRFAMHGRTRDMGLGAYPQISPAAARKLAGKFREMIKEGVDPIERRHAERAAQRVAAAKSLTFDQCVRDYIADHEAGWRNAKHRAQWTSTLARYASPVFGKLPASEVDGGLVLRALKAIWYSKPETASRVRGRIESVLDWARVHGYRSGENPARWKGNLDHLLPARAKVRRVEHHDALPYAEVGAFMAALRQRGDLATSALEFVILTAARSGEALIITCGHVFRDAVKGGHIWVDLFGLGAPQGVLGKLIDYDLNAEIGLIRIETNFPVSPARLAPQRRATDRPDPVRVRGALAVGSAHRAKPTQTGSDTSARTDAVGRLATWCVRCAAGGRPGSSP